MITKRFLILLIAIWMPFFSSFSYAQLPSDPSIAHGYAHIDLSGNQLTITNTPNTILNWQNFSIGSQENVYFQQQDATSMVLNRVTGGDPSHILGNLSSNGHVWLINPYGVLFGPDARIDVAGLIASTLDISNIDFLANRHQFNTSSHAGEVKNQGEIHTTLGGRVWLMGDQVSNEGLVQTQAGQIVLAAGKSIELVDSGAPNVIVKVKAPENETVNLGSLVAPNSGKIDLHGSIVNQEGIVRANSLNTDASGHVVLTADQISLAANSETQADKGLVQIQADTTLNSWGKVNAANINFSAQNISQQGQIIAPGGNVNLNTTGVTELYGLVDVSNLGGVGGNIHVRTEKLQGTVEGALRADGYQGGHIRVESFQSAAFSSMMTAVGETQGGHIEVTGERIFLLNADINATGGEQGGKIHLGGGWQGGGDLQHAREVFIGKGSEINVSGGAHTNSKGGEIAVWSTQRSDHYGSLFAKEGGQIELSSQGQIYQAGDIQVGRGGTVLYDPKNLIITNNPPSSLDVAWRLISGSLSNQPALNAGDNFGSSIALSGDLLAVGAPGGEVGKLDYPGAVWLFEGAGNNGALTYKATIRPDSFSVNNNKNNQDDIKGLQFGAAVALGDNKLLVGVPGDDNDSDDGTNPNLNLALDKRNQGAVYVYDNVNSILGDYSQVPFHKIKIDDNTAFYDNSNNSHSFAVSISMLGKIVVIGAPQEESVFIYKLDNLNNGPDFAIKGCGASAPNCNNNGNSLWQNAHYCDSTTCGTQNRYIGGFGLSLSLDNEGSKLRLAVGAPNELCNGVTPGCGAVFLYDLGTANSLTQPKVIGAIGSDLVGSVHPNQVTFNGLGAGVSLDGGSLVVKGESLSDPIYLFNDVYSGLTDNPPVFNPTFNKALAKSDFSNLNASDEFGSALLLDSANDRLFVGYKGYSDGVASGGAVYLLKNIYSASPVQPPVNFGDAPASGVSYITPAALEAQLDQGSDVTLQANNDITIQSAINVNEGGSGGDLTLQAGRSIIFAANIDTDNGNLTAIAGDPGANSNNRDPGTPTLIINNGVNLNVGTGLATLAAINGIFDNNNQVANSAIQTTGAGRWMIYAANPNTTSEGFARANYNKHYNQSFTKDVIPGYASAGNWFLYSVQPELKVSAPTDIKITYGEEANFPQNVLFTPEQKNTLITGFIDGDTADQVTSLAGGMTWKLTSTKNSSSGHLVAGKHDVSYVSGLDNDLGYKIVDNTDITNELTVEKKIINVASFTASDKVYDSKLDAGITDAIFTGLVPNDIATFQSGVGSFNDKNVGIDKAVTFISGDLTGIDKDNYELVASNTTVTDLASITPKLIEKVSFTIANKEYTADTKATIINGVPVTDISGDNVFISGGIANFSDPNAGDRKLVNITNYSLDGADKGNYVLQTFFETAEASISKATLTYVASPTIGVIGTTLPKLTGDIKGFLGSDSIKNSVTGPLIWTTSANSNSPEGQYPIYGSGLESNNYKFAQAASNEFALTMKIFNGEAPSVKQITTSTAVQSVNAAISGAASTTDNLGEGKVIDMIASAASTSNFGRLSLAQMSRPEMQRLFEERREFKDDLFAEALHKLELDSNLSEVPACSSLAEIDSGSCKITENQLKELKEKQAQDLNQRKEKYGSSIKKATIPEIERKFIVLFGIDQYTDKAIPTLENANSDIEAVGKLFADKLGYELRIIRNATKEDIVRGFNQLAAEVGKQDSVVVYYAGHGYSDQKKNVGYWIPSDASSRNPATWISNKSISEMLLNISSRQIVMISDSCYSGVFASEQVISEVGTIRPDDILTKRSVVVMTSGGDEPVADEGKSGHSVFAWYLMETLRGVDNWKIGSNVFEQVQRAVVKDFPQTPRYGAAISAGHQAGGDYLFEFRQRESLR